MKNLGIVVLGTKSEIKILANSRAFANLRFTTDSTICVDADSEVSPIPQGFEETYRGANNRAMNAQRLVPEGNYFFGHESGLITTTKEIPPVDIAICIIRDVEKIVAMGTSPGLMYPVEALQRAYERAKDTGDDPLRRKGAIINWGDPSDPHYEITKGYSNRAQLLEIGIWCALIHLL